ncbi:MAG: hypothetical protein ABIM42_02535 [candidate division WOR-3 bacterium]
MNKRFLRKYSKYLIGFLLVWLLYQNAVAIYDYLNTLLTNKKYKRHLLHLKARLYTLIARSEYIQTEEGARKVLENKLKEIGN